MTKTIKNNKDVTDSLGHSLDDIGSIIVLIFFASLFINVYEEFTESYDNSTGRRIYWCNTTYFAKLG